MPKTPDVYALHSSITKRFECVRSMPKLRQVELAIRLIRDYGVNRC